MRICIPIRENNLIRAKKQMEKAIVKLRNRKDSLIEIWFDNLVFESKAEIVNLIKSSKLPVIAVCKAKVEKGSFTGAEQERVDVLKTAVESGAQLVDVGMETDLSLIRGLKAVCDKQGAKLIISKHFRDSMPDLSRLEAIYDKAASMGADMAKIAVFVDEWEQNAILFEFCKRLNDRGKKFILIGMGEKGKISRLGCPLLGSYLTYVALDDKSRTADGQLTLAELKEIGI